MSERGASADTVSGLYAVTRRTAAALQQQMAATNERACLSEHDVGQLPGTLHVRRSIGKGRYGQVSEVLFEAHINSGTEQRAVAMKIQQAHFMQGDFVGAQSEAAIMKWLSDTLERAGASGQLPLGVVFAFPAFYLATWCVPNPPPRPPDLPEDENQELAAGTPVRCTIMMEMMGGERVHELMYDLTRDPRRPKHRRRQALWGWLMRAAAVPAFAMDELGLYHNDYTVSNTLVANLALTMRQDVASVVQQQPSSSNGNAADLDNPRASLRRSFGLTALHEADPDYADLIAPDTFARTTALPDDDDDAAQRSEAVFRVPFVRVYDFGLAVTPRTLLHFVDDPAAPGGVRFEQRVRDAPLHGFELISSNMAYYVYSLYLEGLLPSKQAQLVARLFDADVLRRFAGANFVYRQGVRSFSMLVRRERTYRVQVRDSTQYPRAGRAGVTAQQLDAERRQWADALLPEQRRMIIAENAIMDAAERGDRAASVLKTGQRRVPPLSAEGHAAFASLEAWHAWVDAAFAGENVLRSVRAFSWWLYLPLTGISVSGVRTGFASDPLLWEHIRQAEFDGLFVLRDRWDVEHLGVAASPSQSDYVEYNGMRADPDAIDQALFEALAHDGDLGVQQWLFERSRVRAFGSVEMAQQALSTVYDTAVEEQQQLSDESSSSSPPPDYSNPPMMSSSSSTAATVTEPDSGSATETEDEDF
jgi:hypothetical protein